MRTTLDEKFIKGTALVAAGSARKQVAHWDESLGGFGLVVGQRARTFIMQVDVAGTAIRVTLGRWGELTAKDARDLAATVKGILKRLPSAIAAKGQAAQIVARAKADMGLAPAAPTVAEPTTDEPMDDGPSWKRLTLREALDIHVKKKDVSKRTEKMMRDEMGRHLADWIDRPLVSITKTMCDERHCQVKVKNGHSSGGPVAANRAMRFLRACWRSAFKTIDDAPPHPVSGVTFEKTLRRRESIPWPRLPQWAAQVNEISNPVRRDLFWMFLLTGLRSEDCRTMRWEHVNLTDEDVVIDVPRHGKAVLEVTIPPRSVYRPRPKGGEDRAFSIPLSGPALAILKRRQTDNPKQFGDDAGWVFPSRDRVGRIICVREAKTQEYYRDETGNRRKRTAIASPHRCRDTFATACNEARIDLLTIKVLMNHLPPEQDVTLGYMGSNVDHLREAAEKVAALLIGKAKTMPDAMIAKVKSAA